MTEKLKHTRETNMTPKMEIPFWPTHKGDLRGRYLSRENRLLGKCKT